LECDRLAILKTGHWWRCCGPADHGVGLAYRGTGSSAPTAHADSN
jgi:hypothetical protein